MVARNKRPMNLRFYSRVLSLSECISDYLPMFDGVMDEDALSQYLALHAPSEPSCIVGLNSVERR